MTREEMVAWEKARHAELSDENRIFSAIEVASTQAAARIAWAADRSRPVKWLMRSPAGHTLLGEAFCLALANRIAARDGYPPDEMTLIDRSRGIWEW